MRLGVGGPPRRRDRAHRARAARGARRTQRPFPIFRLDADAATLDARARTLQAFEHAAAGVLVGTQMVAKGHDFPDVSLGVVLDADQTLRFPDFRAEERTFALITQLAGRTGRGARAAAAVLVQTLAPDARPIAYAVRHDSDGFVADELSRREALSYPPYASLIRVVCSAPEEALARETARRPARRAGGARRRPCSARRRCSGCAAARAASWWSRRPTAPAGDRRRRRGPSTPSPRRRPARGQRQRRRRPPVSARIDRR